MTQDTTNSADQDPCGSQLAAAVRVVCPDRDGQFRAPESDGLRLLERLEQSGLSTEDQLRTLSRVLKVPFFESVNEHAPSAEFIERVPISFARQHSLLGLAAECLGETARMPADCSSKEACTQNVMADERTVSDEVAGSAQPAKSSDRPPEGSECEINQRGVQHSNGEDAELPVVLGAPQSWFCLDVISRFLNRKLVPVFAPSEQVQAAINRAYEQRVAKTEEFIETLEVDDVMSMLGELERRQDLLDLSDRAPVIKLVNLILFDAVMGSASDVHIQPYERQVYVRMRIDGVLFDTFQLPKTIQEEILSRVKVIGRMNIAEKRLPQDGRATVRVGDRVVDLRIASMPTSHGERIVLRLLDKSARLYTLGELGMDSTTLSKYRELIHLEHGLILVTGPTGSGKSTTLYATLTEINSKDRNVVTLEDPIEYELDGISQTQINQKKGMTFASGLRSVLRQDPDIIMVGEIRDHETAVMAIQSALTGHLVFSTLHTNDSASAVTRLLDLGIEPYLVASSVISVLAQRLVRCICSDCRTAETGRKDLLGIGIDAAGQECSTVYSGTGCKACRHTGYRGRIGLFELLMTDQAIRDHIQQRSNAAEVRDAAAAAGMRLLREDGIQKVRDGVTTADEVVRVSMRADL